MKVHGYVYATKKFTRTCVPSRELSFTYVPFLPEWTLTVTNGGAQRQFYPSAFWDDLNKEPLVESMTIKKKRKIGIAAA